MSVIGILKERRITVLQLAVALILAYAAGKLAVYYSAIFYGIAPFHYDSAAYLFTAIKEYQFFQLTGRLPAIWAALHQKDSLDVVLRLIFAPSKLKTLFGHLYIALFFLAGFIFLLLHYVYQKTASWIATLIPIAALFALPLIYAPYQGLADYWKESIATWIFSSIVITWILSENLKFKRWSMLCGLLCALLAMERTALAVYMAALIAPLLISAIVMAKKQNPLSVVMKQLLFFIYFPTLLLAFLLITQAKELFEYYVMGGYGYAPVSQVFIFLWQVLMNRSGFELFVLLIGLILLLLQVGNWRENKRDIVIAFYFVIGFPTLVALMHGMYNEFYAVWSVLVICLIAVLAAAGNKQLKYSSLLANITFIIFGVSVFFQIYQSSSLAVQTANQNGFIATKLLFNQISNNIQSIAKPPYRIGLLYNEDYERLILQMYYFNGLNLNIINSSNAGGFTIHDSYYKQRSELNHIPLPRYLSHMEKQLDIPGTIAVSYCLPSDVAKSSAFGTDGQKIAEPMATKLAKYLLTNDHWQAITRYDSPYGCLFEYRYSEQPLSINEKWSQLSFDNPLPKNPIQLNVPGTALYNVESLYHPEWYNGNYVLWLPGNNQVGLSLLIYANNAQNVVLNSAVMPGPARTQVGRTILIKDNGAQVGMVNITQTGNISIPFSLQKGINTIQISVDDKADSMALGGDPRQLMLLLGPATLTQAS